MTWGVPTAVVPAHQVFALLLRLPQATVQGGEDEYALYGTIDADFGRPGDKPEFWQERGAHWTSVIYVLLPASYQYLMQAGAALRTAVDPGLSYWLVEDSSPVYDGTNRIRITAREATQGEVTG